MQNYFPAAHRSHKLNQIAVDTYSQSLVGVLACLAWHTDLRWRNRQTCFFLAPSGTLQGVGSECSRHNCTVVAAAGVVVVAVVADTAAAAVAVAIFAADGEGRDSSH